MANLRICSVLGCGKPHVARGWCNAHYHRWFLYGDPEYGGPLGPSKGEVTQFYNEVVRSYDGDECLIWPYGKDRRGYAQTNLKDKRGYVSRLVCEEEYGPPPSPEHQAAHSCGNGHLGCVAKRHLRWATPVENSADKLLHGTHQFGERNAQAKLSAQDVLEIRQSSETGRALAKRFGVQPSCVSRIRTGKRWPQIE